MPAVVAGGPVPLPPGGRHVRRHALDAVRHEDVSFDPATKRPMLNGRPYYLRGTNVCIFRFFEDAARGDRPWRREWVQRLHQVFRGMNWNSARYCIGFPPEQWYDVADELGFLIQDEFPIWYVGENPFPGNSAAKSWPASTPSGCKSDEPPRVCSPGTPRTKRSPRETGKAIRAVRGLDLSHRPWDKGWSPAPARRYA